VSAAYLESYADSGLYTMQGRLSPPEDGRFQSFPRSAWAAEIELAPQVPLRGIEWIYDLYGEGVNPLDTAHGRVDLENKLQQSGVSVVSICADYFMDCPFLRIEKSLLEERIAKLKWLISVCPQLRITRIVLPFVDASRISSSKDSEDALFVLNQVLEQTEQCGVELHLETDLNPREFKFFLDEIKHPLIKVNYDSGNSASLGYAPVEEFAAYGDRIGSFHIKDRVLGGSTVPLGTGNVDFASLRKALIDIDYQGDFVMQVARSTPGDELNWLKHAAVAASNWLRGDSIIN
jgi:L-ribulose-5-phosphate 3-epimerase